MADEAVRVRGLRKRYAAGVEALCGLNLSVQTGQVYGVVGPDGAGKTTLMKVLAGVLSFQAEEAQVLGRPVPDGLAQVRHHIGYLPQRFSLYGDLTVEENLDFYAALYPPDPEGGRTRQELLEMIGLDPFRDRMAADLSGGMKQKLALLCNLVHRPRLLLMDEPTVGVDPVSRREFWTLVFELQRGGLTVLASTPYMDEAEQFDRVALLSEGTLVREGTPAEIRASVPGVVLELVCQRPFQAARCLEGAPGIQDVQLFGDRLHLFAAQDAPALRQALDQRLGQAGLQVQRLRVVPFSIEDVFLRLTT
jgi:ABC-2 type transport system ATP-binding protein